MSSLKRGLFTPRGQKPHPLGGDVLTPTPQGPRGSGGALRAAGWRGRTPRDGRRGKPLGGGRRTWAPHLRPPPGDRVARGLRLPESGPWCSWSPRVTEEGAAAGAGPPGRGLGRGGPGGAHQRRQGRSRGPRAGTAAADPLPTGVSAPLPGGHHPAPRRARRSPLRPSQASPRPRGAPARGCVRT